MTFNKTSTSEVLSHVRLMLCVITVGFFSAGVPGAASQWRVHNPDVAEAIPIVVSPYGFAQTNIALPPGIYVFVVLNRTGFDDVTVYLERMPGSSVTDPPSQQEFGDSVGASRARLIKTAKLIPGTYRLRVDKRPAWVSVIRVN